ncbi:vitamin B6 biosynthesis protein [Irpex lacteus]|nr:vitamin B6 biosynthesis protein [Irpex lacteus]
MATPAQTPNGSGSPLPAIPHGVGNSTGTPVMAPSRQHAKDGVSNSSLGTFGVKSGLAQMLKGGVIMDVVNAEQARIAEEAGACAVMALERVPADIRAEGGVARMSDPQMIKEIVDAVTIPVMAKVRIGHFVEAQILQAIGIDYIDESEVLTPADDEYHINKHAFKVPFVCGCRNLGEALRRISEGAAFIRTKGEAGTGNVVEAVSTKGPSRARSGSPRSISQRDRTSEEASGGELRCWRHCYPADAALMMQLGCDGVFVGSGIFHSGDPAKRARHHYNNPKLLAEVSENLGEAMVGLTISDDLKGGRFAKRGW